MDGWEDMGGLEAAFCRREKARKLKTCMHDTVDDCSLFFMLEEGNKTDEGGEEPAFDLSGRSPHNN